MPDTTLTTELPPRTTTSTRGSRKWATLGGRSSSSASTTRIPTNDSETNEIPMKTNGHQRQSSSLFRKASTISRTEDTPITSDDPNVPSLKKSRSLMNVLRSKFNSPAVLRRFRSKSRESTKQTVTEIPGPSHDEQEPQIKQSNPEQTTRKSRKRDPSPMRRLANRITQLTRHQKTTSPERQKKSPAKSITIDSHEETRKSTSPLHNKDEVEHINACYDEIRAKYFTNNTTTSKRPIATDEPQDRSFNGTLPSNDLPQRISPLLPTSDDPLLQARKQTNIKLNCLLSGYSLTTSFANHEKLYGQNDLFKFNHYYDVGKRKYDYNFTNQNNRIFSTMKTRPMSKSIDSFRRTTTNDNEVPLKLEKLPVVDHEPFVHVENDQNVSRILVDDNELFIREDNDLIQSEPNALLYSTHVEDVESTSEEKRTQSTTEEQDEEFERDFLRAVDRALGVVNKDEKNIVQANEDLSPTKIDESPLNLVQITEQALSSLNNSSIFTNEEQKNEHTEAVDQTDESSKTQQQSPVETEKLAEEESLQTTIEEPASEDLLNVSTEKVADEELSKIDNEKSTNEDSTKVDIQAPMNEDITNISVEQTVDEKPTNEDLVSVSLENSAKEELPKVETEKPADEEFAQIDNQEPKNEDFPKVSLDKAVTEESPKIAIEKPTDDDSPKVNIEEPTKEDLLNDSLEKSADEESSKVVIDKTTDEDSSKADIEESTKEDLLNDSLEKSADEESSKVVIDKTIDEDSPKVDTTEPTKEDLLNVSLEKSLDEDSLKADTEVLTSEDSLNVSLEKSVDEELPKFDVQESKKTQVLNVNNEKPTHDESPTIDIEKPAAEDLTKSDIPETTNQELLNVSLEKSANEESPKVETTEEDLPKAEIRESTNEELLNVSAEKPTIDIEEPIEDKSSTIATAEPTDESLSKVTIEESATQDSSKAQIEESTAEDLTNAVVEKAIADDLVDETIRSVVEELSEKVDEFLFEDSKNGRTFLVKLDAEEKIIRDQAETFNQILQTKDDRLTEEVRTDINAVIGEVNLLLRGKLKQFRGLCIANVTKSTGGEPIPLDGDLEGFWDITYPLIDKVKEKFAKLDARQAKQWAVIEEYDPNDVNNRPRHIDDRSKQLPSHPHKTSKIPIPKSANEDLKKLIQERRKAAANPTNQNEDIEIFLTPK